MNPAAVVAVLIIASMAAVAGYTIRVETEQRAHRDKELRGRVFRLEQQLEAKVDA